MEHIKGNIFEHIKGMDEYFLYHPLLNAAYHVIMQGENEGVYVKHHGAEEKPVSCSNKDFCDAYFFATVMSKEEYENL